MFGVVRVGWQCDGMGGGQGWLLGGGSQGPRPPLRAVSFFFPPLRNTGFPLLQ
jgi:hypothetical protein